MKPVATPYSTRRRLEHLHDILGLNWRKIAEMPEFNGVSFGTLNMIYHGRYPKDEEICRKLGWAVPETQTVYRNKIGRYTGRK